MLDDDEKGPKEAYGDSVLMLCSTCGKEKSLKSYKEMLSTRGFVDIQHKFNPDPHFLNAIIAKKP